VSLLVPGLSSFVGRQRELEAVMARLASARLVTLTGAGGSGKTRLALEVAERIAATQQRRIEIVELAALRDPALLPATIAGALGLRATGGAGPLELVARHLGSAEVLLVLDNLEQLLPAACATLVELLAGCPGLRLLVTSRVPLRLAAEHLVHVEPLPVPVAGDGVESLLAVPSVALFVDRARASGVELDLDGAEAEAVAAICRRLDGLPLAIELAAARLRLLPPGALLARLEHRLGILTAGPLDAPERQRTVRATIAWSVALLPPREAALFPRLGVFVGGFTLPAALAVAGAGIVEIEDELLEALAVLVDHNLLLATSDVDDDARFAMLETIREYAVEHLEDEATLRDRHLAFYLALAEEADGGLSGPGHRRAVEVLGIETENLRAALAWAEERERGSDLLRLATALGRYWCWHADPREGLHRLERAIVLAGPNQPTLAWALVALGRMLLYLGMRSRSREVVRQALATARELGDERAEGRALLGCAIEHIESGRPADAARALEDVLVIGRRLPDTTLVADGLLLMGNVAWEQSDYELALELQEEGISVARSCGDASTAGILLHNLAMLHRQLGDPVRALGLLSEALETAASVEDRQGEGWAILGQAIVFTDLGRLREARLAIHRALELAAPAHSPDDQTQALETAARWLGAAGSPLEALRAWSAHERSRREMGTPYRLQDRLRNEPLIASERRAIGEPQASIAWAEGAGMELSGALEVALAVMDRLDPVPQRPNPVVPHGQYLTGREVEVLALVGKGCSDGEIAERLFISKKTASVHVANIKDKLGTENRVETALAAVRMGLVRPMGEPT
jgi:predicted ATPase/DNA-binding CsgD family transcriptional regulator